MLIEPLPQTHLLGDTSSSSNSNSIHSSRVRPLISMRNSPFSIHPPQPRLVSLPLFIYIIIRIFIYPTSYAHLIRQSPFSSNNNARTTCSLLISLIIHPYPSRIPGHSIRAMTSLLPLLHLYTIHMDEPNTSPTVVHSIKAIQEKLPGKQGREDNPTIYNNSNLNPME
jgi:hypothetical protein